MIYLSIILHAKYLLNNHSKHSFPRHQDNTIFINDSTKAPAFNDSLYTKIIHVETFSDYSDPNKTMLAWFYKKGYQVTKIKDDYIGVKITTYQKK